MQSSKKKYDLWYYYVHPEKKLKAARKFCQLSVSQDGKMALKCFLRLTQESIQMTDTRKT